MMIWTGSCSSVAKVFVTRMERRTFKKLSEECVYFQVKKRCVSCVMCHVSPGNVPGCARGAGDRSAGGRRSAGRRLQSGHGQRILGKTEMALQHRANGQQFAS